MYVLIGFLIFPALIGLFTMYHWFRPQKSPADTSNRINAIKLWWFALTREDKFAGKFEWLTKDEWENNNQDTVIVGNGSVSLNLKNPEVVEALLKNLDPSRENTIIDLEAKINMARKNGN